MSEAGRPSLFTIGAHRSFADALAAGLIAEHGRDPLGLARSRILLPNNRAIRTVTEAFVRASGSGLLLPRLIAIGDPELDDRLGEAFESAADAPVPPAIDPLERLVIMTRLVRRQRPDASAAEAFRLAAELARTRDALLVEEIAPERLADVVPEELAGHWQASLRDLRVMLNAWPQELARLGRIDLADRRNRLLRGTARRWAANPPEGFTVAAGITTSAPAVAALLKVVATLPGGSVVLPALSGPALLDEDEWDWLGPDHDSRRADETHPQFHLKRLLDRLDVRREEVEPWRRGGRAAAPRARSGAIATAMKSARFTSRWADAGPAERRLTGVRLAEFGEPASEAQGIAIALREALETPGRTAALVTPDRALAARVSALLGRWDIRADDSAGRPLGQTAAGTLLLAIAAAAAEQLAPVPMLALLKHPLAGAGEDRQSWLEAARLLDLALRGPRPPAGLAGLDAHCAEKEKARGTRGCGAAWAKVRPCLERVDRTFGRPLSLPAFAAMLRELATGIAGDAAWSGPDGRAAAKLLAGLEEAEGALSIDIRPEDAVPLLRQLLDAESVRPPYGGHPRIQILGLLEARLVQADLMILGGLNEGTWPALPNPDPWLAPAVRKSLGLPGLEFRIGLSAHDFAGFLGAPRVLLTRARRDSRSPTVASRLLLRLQALTGGLARDHRIERLASALDDAGPPKPVNRPAPSPPAADRPRQIYVTDVDRLNADPFAFYAKAMLKLRALEPVDADTTAAWKGSAVHAVLEAWLKEDECDPARLMDRTTALLAEDAIHPLLRALWAPRLHEAIAFIAATEASNQGMGRRPLKAEIEGQAVLGDITLKGKADRLDRLADGRLAVLDYKTGQPPSKMALAEGFALQLGLLGLIAEKQGFADVGGAPGAHEYWSLAKKSGARTPGFVMDADLGDPEAFLAAAAAAFTRAADKWLTGGEPFTAKLHPAFAPYGDYDQLMRLEEWYGRD
ncbi:double-strand break repair protein AddB [Sphingomonas sp. KRR8]|uniref:double-strand break repair protein AddB n=1 Tax=Sphingomonas sp. KRR8 TaxID=2942996 RepID=UPI0020229750|nr:double-strand break repair protein AddB [Sphingomonas sp. KRR8]URD61882.1 double-strand break repair protein AddB [Sphingomonas sp. KRR8]